MYYHFLFNESRFIGNPWMFFLQKIKYFFILIIIFL